MISKQRSSYKDNQNQQHYTTQAHHQRNNLDNDQGPYYGQYQQQKHQNYKNSHVRHHSKSIHTKNNKQKRPVPASINKQPNYHHAQDSLLSSQMGLNSHREVKDTRKSSSWMIRSYLSSSSSQGSQSSLTSEQSGRQHYQSYISASLLSSEQGYDSLGSFNSQRYSPLQSKNRDHYIHYHGNKLRKGSKSKSGSKYKSKPRPSQRQRMFNRLLELELQLTHKLNLAKKRKIQALQQYNAEYDRFTALEAVTIRKQNGKANQKTKDKYEVTFGFNQKIEKNTQNVKQIKLQSILTELHQLESKIQKQVACLPFDKKSKFEKLIKLSESIKDNKYTSHIANSDGNNLPDIVQFQKNINLQQDQTLRNIQKIVKVQHALQLLSTTVQRRFDQNNSWTYSTAQKSSQAANLQKKKKYLITEIKKMNQILNQIQQKGKLGQKVQKKGQGTDERHFKKIHQFYELQKQLNKRQQLFNTEMLVENEQDQQQKILLFQDITKKKAKSDKLSQENKLLKLILANYKQKKSSS